MSEDLGFVAGSDRDESLRGIMGALTGGTMSRREFVARAAAAGLSLSAIGALAAACGSDSGSGGGDAKPSQLDTTLPSELIVYNWDDYIAPSAIKSFEKKTGVKVVLKPKFYDIPEAYAAMKDGLVCDVVIPTNAFLSNFVDAGLVQPLQMDLLPNFANVTDAALAKPPYDSGSGGKKYSVPYMFGTTGFAVRLDKVKNPSESWKMLWDETYKGEIGMLDDSVEGMSIGLILSGLEIGTSDQASIDKATKLLMDQKPLVAHYSSSKITDDITEGMPLRHCWDGDAILAINRVGLSKVRYVLPEEGFPGWADTICVSASSPSPYAAHLFLDHLLDSKVAGENANYTGYQPGPATADPYIESLVQRAMRPTAEVLAKAKFSTVSNETQDAYEAAWKKVTG